jgi:hypothetical protein
MTTASTVKETGLGAARAADAGRQSGALPQDRRACTAIGEQAADNRGLAGPPATGAGAMQGCQPASIRRQALGATAAGSGWPATGRGVRAAAGALGAAGVEIVRVRWMAMTNTIRKVNIKIEHMLHTIP